MITKKMNNIFETNISKTIIWANINCVWSLNQVINNYKSELHSLIHWKELDMQGITLEQRVLNTPWLEDRAYDLADMIIKNKISNGL